MHTIRTRKRKWIRWSAGAVMAIVVALAGLAYLYDKPGGIADWQFSRATKMSSTIRIPIGQTPEEAVQKFRGDEKRQALLQADTDGGVLLFYNRSENAENANLQIEYVRKTWLGGWKWVWGGGYGQPVNTEEALSFMAIPKNKGIRGPFPILFGYVTDAAVESVVVKAGSQQAGGTKAESKNAVSIKAEIASYGPDRRIWYAVLPASAVVPYKIEAINGEGESIGAASTDDARDAGRVLKNH